MAAWYEEAEFYHIYPIGLTGAPRKNEGGEVVHRFPMLTEEWLPHIAELGCRGIYIGPLFESTTHGYDTKDYKTVDRRLGDNQDFKAFVRRAHELGIKVVVENFLHLLIYRRIGKIPVIAVGIKGSGLGEIHIIMMDFLMRHGEIVLNL